MLDELLLDIRNQLKLVTTSSSDSLFSPTKIATTVCQYYFLFIGRLSRSHQGRSALDRHTFLTA